MKTRSSILTRFALLLDLAIGAAGLPVGAQEAPVLEIALYPGIRVTGEVGATYVIESKNGVDDDFWLTRGWLELTTPTAMWMDPVPADSPRRVYRAVRMTKSAVQTVANMVWIPPGRFTMGSPESERGRFDWEGPQTRVTLRQGFWLGKYEVTVGEYLAVIGGNPCVDPADPGALDRPVVCVSWDDAVAYCQALTERERAAGRIATNAVYRLPPEAEWEYACRAGTTTRYSFGDALGCGDGCEYCALFDSYMWWCGNGWPGRVGQKLPNPWGLYDLHGNVAEWCQDWLDGEHPEYPGGAVVDPQGPPTGSDRVIRGDLFIARIRLDLLTNGKPWHPDHDRRPADLRGAGPEGVLARCVGRGVGLHRGRDTGDVGAVEAGVRHGGSGQRNDPDRLLHLDSRGRTPWTGEPASFHLSRAEAPARSCRKAPVAVFLS